MLMIDLQPVSKHQGLLREIALDFRAQRAFPRTAQHHVKDGGGRRDDNQKNGQQFEEDTVLQVSSTVLFGGRSSYEIRGCLTLVAVVCHRTGISTLYCPCR